MKQTEIVIPAEYVSSLHINGMRGRVLQIPAKKKTKVATNILLVYGHHSSIERMFSLASYLSEFGTITMPDLPGFGGMDSFYVINKRPTLDNMADYLATFIKLTYKNKPITVCGMSYGFLVVTRMLQKYPDMTKQVQLIVSLVGFSSASDFSFSPARHRLLSSASAILSMAPMSDIAKHFALTRPFITLTYTLSARRHVKMKDATKEERTRRIRFELYLWQCNDARTYFATSHDFLTIDITHTTVSLPLEHVAVKQDQYFKKKVVINHLKKIFDSVRVYTADLPNHAPTVISDETEASNLLPNSLKRRLRTIKLNKV